MSEGFFLYHIFIGTERLCFLLKWYEFIFSFSGPEEFEYPKSERLNKIVNVMFIVLFVGFNVLYWSVAMIVYFS